MNHTLLEILQLVLLILLLLSNRSFVKTCVLLCKRAIVISLHFLSKFVPKSRNLVVFGGENGLGFRGNPRYLFLEMSKNPNIRCVWITKSRKVEKEISGMGYPVFYHHTFKGMIYQLRAKLVIHSHAINDDFNKYLLGGAISYNTWHGVGLKKVWGANKSTFSYKILHETKGLRRLFGTMVVKTNMAKVNYVVSTSPRVSSYYPETFLVPKANVLELGQVRNDVFFKETEKDLEIPEWIRSGKIITYMPTHRKQGKLDKDINLVIDFQRLNELCAKLGYTFVIKRHMYSSGITPTSFPYIKDISKENYDPQMLLKYTDILITDYSSCYTDFLLLDRPVLFYCYDLDTYLRKSNEMYFNYFDVTPGPKAYGFDELLTFIEDAAENPKEYAKERERVLNIFYSKENQREVLQKQVEYICRNILQMEKEDGSS